MRYSVKKLKNLTIALAELEPHIRDGRSLQVHREFKSFKQRPRELLANWLVCAVLCDGRGEEALAIADDPFGGDGLIVDRKTEEKMFTEHVYIPTSDEVHIGASVVKAVEHKAKKGKEYAKGRTLVIFSDAIGRWIPNHVAREIVGRHQFDGVWFVTLDAPASAIGRYAYNVAELDVSIGDAPVCRVLIAEDFGSWTVERVQ